MKEVLPQVDMNAAIEDILKPHPDTDATSPKPKPTVQSDNPELEAVLSQVLEVTQHEIDNLRRQLSEDNLKSMKNINNLFQNLISRNQESTDGNLKKLNTKMTQLQNSSMDNISKFKLISLIQPSL